MRAPLQIERRSLDDELEEISLTGEIDLTNAETVEATIDAAVDAGARYLLFDARGLTFMDSTGLRVFVLTKGRADERGGAVAVVCNDPNMLRLFGTARLDVMLGVVPTHEEAMANLDAVRRRAAPREG